MFITVNCPECNEETEHEVITESRDLLVRCTTCGHHQRIKKDTGTPVNPDQNNCLKRRDVDGLRD